MIRIAFIIVAFTGIAAAQPAEDAKLLEGLKTQLATLQPGAPADEIKKSLVAVCGRAFDESDKFADHIIKVAEVKVRDKVRADQVLKDECTIFDHKEAEAQIATNERHVIIAYIAMWLVAAALLVFMWRRQVALRGEVAQLRRDLEAAAKDGAP
jgi:hypothetical protein